MNNKSQTKISVILLILVSLLSGCKKSPESDVSEEQPIDLLKKHGAIEGNKKNLN